MTALRRLCQGKRPCEPQYHRNKKKVRACAQMIFALKMVLSSVPKSMGERSRGTDTLVVECVWPFFSPHRMVYLAIEHDLISGRWGKEMAPMGWRWGASGGGTKRQPSQVEGVEEKVLVKQAGGWSWHLWWHVCSDQRKRWGFVWVWRRRYLCLEDSQWMGFPGVAGA